jgi:hypothetical protein
MWLMTTEGTRRTTTISFGIHNFERKVYRRIVGPVYEKEIENWRILTNKEICAVVKNSL